MATANGGESNNAESTDKRYTAIDVHLSVQNGTKNRIENNEPPHK